MNYKQMNECKNKTQPNWTEVTAQDGSVFYYNKSINLSTWEKPKELLTELESKSGWSLQKGPGGKEYYFNPALKQSVWEEPEEYIKIKTLSNNEIIKNSNNFNSSKDSNMNNNINIKANTNILANNRNNNNSNLNNTEFDQSKNNINTNSTTKINTNNRNALVSDQKEDISEYKNYSKQQLEEVFKDMMKKEGVSSAWSWEDAERLLTKNKIWKVIKTFQEKKQLFNEYIKECRVREKEEYRFKKEKIKMNFRCLLEEDTKISSDSKYSDFAVKYFNDDRWKALDEREREEEFENFLDELEKREDEEKNIILNTKLNQFKEFLENEVNCDFNTTWREVIREVICKQYKNSSYYESIIKEEKEEKEKNNIKRHVGIENTNFYSAKSKRKSNERNNRKDRAIDDVSDDSLINDTRNQNNSRYRERSRNRSFSKYDEKRSIKDLDKVNNNFKDQSEDTIEKFLNNEYTVEEKYAMLKIYSEHVDYIYEEYKKEKQMIQEEEDFIKRENFRELLLKDLNDGELRKDTKWGEYTKRLYYLYKENIDSSYWELLGTRSSSPHNVFYELMTNLHDKFKLLREDIKSEIKAYNTTNNSHIIDYPHFSGLNFEEFNEKLKELFSVYYEAVFIKLPKFFKYMIYDYIKEKIAKKDFLYKSSYNSDNKNYNDIEYNRHRESEYDELNERKKVVKDSEISEGRAAYKLKSYLHKKRFLEKYNSFNEEAYNEIITSFKYSDNLSKSFIERIFNEFIVEGNKRSRGISNGSNHDVKAVQDIRESKEIKDKRSIKYILQDIDKESSLLYNNKSLKVTKSRNNEYRENNNDKYIDEESSTNSIIKIHGNREKRNYSSNKNNDDDSIFRRRVDSEEKEEGEI